MPDGDQVFNELSIFSKWNLSLQLPQKENLSIPIKLNRLYIWLHHTAHLRSAAELGNANNNLMMKKCLKCISQSMEGVGSKKRPTVKQSKNKKKKEKDKIVMTKIEIDQN